MKVYRVAILALVIAIISLGVSVWAITGDGSTETTIATPAEVTMTPCEVARQQLVDARTEEAAHYANRWRTELCAGSN